MSRFSGKYDLYDHMMMEKTYDKGNCLVSDELECFEIFKAKTNGILHQHHKIKVDIFNQQFVKEHCKEFDFTEVGKNKYSYTYWNKEYTLKELNKHGVWIETEIKFNTLLDLIPYYPYIITCSCSDQDGEYIVIANESFVDAEFESHLQNGWISKIDYKKYLQEHYLEVCQKYFLYKLEERTKRISLIWCKPLHNGYYELLLPDSADYMHEPKFIWTDGKNHSHWTGPKISENEQNVILISEQDIENYLAEDIKNNSVELEYVVKCEFPKELN